MAKTAVCCSHENSVWVRQVAQREEQNRHTKTFKFLPLTLRLETLGGIATPLVLRGTPLPVRRSQVFSTASDNQESVELAVYVGESSLVRNNVKVQTFILKGIPKAARAEPQIQVTFEVDQACHVRVSAAEKKSGISIAVEFDDTQTSLTDDEIDRLLQLAEANRAADERGLKLIEAKNKAESVIAKAEARLKEHQDKGITVAGDRRIEEVLASVGLTIEADDAEKIRATVDELEELISPVGFGGFETYPGFGDIFDSFLSTPTSTLPKVKRQQKAPTQEPIAKVQKLKDQLATSATTTRQLGRIFGGGEFTLEPNLCFVLMPFEETMRPIYDDHIRIVVESEGISCVRADEVVGTKQITWDVWEKINRARFLIADLTGKNPNVFYEVGIAHALGKEVILVSQTMDDVPFDLQALRCITYSYTPPGMKEMESKLRATISQIMKSG